MHLKGPINVKKSKNNKSYAMVVLQTPKVYSIRDQKDQEHLYILDLIMKTHKAQILITYRCPKII